MTDTNNTDGAALLPVTQADREAASQAYHAIAKGYMQVIGCAMEAGAADHAELVQLFARHRAATQEDAERSGVGSDDTSQADRDHAMKWINHNMMLATGLMKSSSEAGNGAENFRAHDAYRALKVAKAALSTPQRQEYDGEAGSWVTTVICATCGGEFDEGEWDADTRCPECEEPKRWNEKRTKLLGAKPPKPATPSALSGDAGEGE